MARKALLDLSIDVEPGDILQDIETLTGFVACHGEDYDFTHRQINLYHAVRAVHDVEGDHEKSNLISPLLADPSPSWGLMYREMCKPDFEHLFELPLWEKAIRFIDENQVPRHQIGIAIFGEDLYFIQRRGAESFVYINNGLSVYHYWHALLIQGVVIYGGAILFAPHIDPSTLFSAKKVEERWSDMLHVGTDAALINLHRLYEYGAVHVLVARSYADKVTTIEVRLKELRSRHLHQDCD